MIKALTLCTLAEPWTLPAGTLDEHLRKRELVDCTGLTAQSRGWTAVNDSGEFAYGYERNVLARYATDTKILPASVVKKEVERKAKEVEARMGFKPGRKQRREFKESVTAELLPKAFSKQRSTLIWIDAKACNVAVASTSTATADEAIALLRDTLGSSLAVDLPRTTVPLQHLMTEWVRRGQVSSTFELDGDAELVHTSDDKPTVKYLRHDLSSEGVRDHIKEGKVVRKLALVWRDQVRFTLNDRLQLSRIAFPEILRENEAGAQDRDAYAQEVAFTLGQLSALLLDLSQTVGLVREST